MICHLCQTVQNISMWAAQTHLSPRYQRAGDSAPWHSQGTLARMHGMAAAAHISNSSSSGPTEHLLRLPASNYAH